MSPQLRKVFDLPAGSRFRYLDPNNTPYGGTFVFLGWSGNGQCADAPAIDPDQTRQGHYSVAESRQEFMDMLVEFVPVCEAGPVLLEALEMVRDADDDAKRDGLLSIPNLPRAKIDAAIAKATGGTT